MTEQEQSRDRAVGAPLRLAVADAIGTTVEFCERDTFPPISGMVGGGLFALKAGEWTYDTAMALSPADSLLSCGSLNQHDLKNRFCRLWDANTDAEMPSKRM
jgi:ADP-ribosyl-[dinitrogen reductase] hydrolase